MSRWHRLERSGDNSNSLSDSYRRTRVHHELGFDDIPNGLDLTGLDRYRATGVRHDAQHARSCTM